ncbi:MAG: sigma-70 family RNA polymerase sigma factor [Verrucomicrobiae bacterium]|nr:sigma-70 family RNA polymerase sigma factor [Verrucomicrobiae bacterium]
MVRDVPTRRSLLLRLRDGKDQEAWAGFVEIYTPAIYGFCRRRGLREADAADVTQDVLRALAGALPRFEYDPERSRFRQWLYTVVRSKLNNFLSAQARRPRLAGETTLARLEGRPPEEGSEEDWQREHREQLVRWAAARIRPEFKAVTWDAFWRTAVVGEPAERVAGDLSLSLNAVYIARSRVIRRLKRTIDTLGDVLDGTGEWDHGG